MYVWKNLLNGLVCMYEKGKKDQDSESSTRVQIHSQQGAAVTTEFWPDLVTQQQATVVTTSFHFDLRV